MRAGRVKLRNQVANPSQETNARARLLLHGADTLSPTELLGLVVGESPPDLGGRILNRFGSLRGAAGSTLAELTDLTGMGPARAVRLKAAFALGRAAGREVLTRGFVLRSSREVFERFHEELRDQKREVFLSILLDGKNRVLREDRVSVGSLTSSIVHPREVFTTAIRESADAVVFVHNHPSGDPTPLDDEVRGYHL